MAGPKKSLNVGDQLTPSEIANALKRHNWWKHLSFPAASALPGVYAPTYDTTNLGWVFAHAPANNEQLQYIIEIPHTWRIGGDVRITIKWALMAVGAATEDVRWDTYYRWYQTGDVIPAFGAVVSRLVDVSSYLLDESLYTFLATPVDPGITQTSSTLEVLLERDTADPTDDFPHDVIVKALGVHYQIDSLGSWAELEKWG